MKRRLPIESSLTKINNGRTFGVIIEIFCTKRKTQMVEVLRTDYEDGSVGIIIFIFFFLHPFNFSFLAGHQDQYSSHFVLLLLPSSLISQITISIIYERNSNKIRMIVFPLISFPNDFSFLYYINHF
jgi:hypothetical protein